MNASTLESAIRDVWTPRVLTKLGLPPDTRMELFLTGGGGNPPALLLLLPRGEQTLAIATGARTLDLTDYAYGIERLVAQLDRQISETARHLAAEMCSQ